MTRIILAILLASAATAAAETEHTLAVTGTGTLSIQPDCADITMTVSVEQPKPIAATTTARSRADAVLAALAKHGLKAPDVTLSALSLSPVYPNGDYVTPRGFRADITLLVTLHDFSKIPTVMEAGADNGTTAMRTEFRRSDMPALKKQVRAMAITAAQEKANDMAKQLGIKLGRVINVAEGTVPRWEASNTYANVATTRTTSTLGGTLQDLTIDVSVTYEL
ncbi:MAG TPA: SIMPL domain-containing protein [Kofleriaceae bacterium]|jgi:hypothetical protein